MLRPIETLPIVESAVKIDRYESGLSPLLIGKSVKSINMPQIEHKLQKFYTFKKVSAQPEKAYNAL